MVRSIGFAVYPKISHQAGIRVVKVNTYPLAVPIYFGTNYREFLR